MEKGRKGGRERGRKEGVVEKGRKGGREREGRKERRKKRKTEGGRKGRKVVFYLTTLTIANFA